METKSNSQFFSTILVLFLIIAGAVYFFLSRDSVIPIPDESIRTQKYISETFGFSFSYPTNYFLEEREVGNGERGHYTIILTENTEENRLVREGKSSPRKGPVAITFDMYQNDLDNLTLEQWVENTAYSNYKLAKGPFMATSLGGKNAVVYDWSGLYEGHTVTVLLPTLIMAVSVTYITPDDQILKDFSDVIQTIEFVN